MKLITALTSEIHPAQWVEVFNSDDELISSAPCEAMIDCIWWKSEAHAEVDFINHFERAAYIKLK